MFLQVKNAEFPQSTHYQRLTEPRENCVFTTERAADGQNAILAR